MMDWLKKHDILLKAMCVAVAMMLWLYVVSTQNPEITTDYKGIKVTFIGQDELLEKHNLTVISGMDSVVSIKVKGQMDAIYQISDNITVSADMSSITTPGEHRLDYRIILPVSGVDVVSYTPATIKVVTDKIVTTKVPVDVEMRGSVPNGYIYGEYKLSSDFVGLEGPDMVLSKIDHARVTVDADDLKETTSWTLDYELLDKNGDAVVSDMITKNDKVILVTLPVTKAKQVPLTAEASGAPGIDPVYVSLDISPSTVTVTGENDVLDTVNQINLGKVDISAVSSGDTVRLPIVLPNGVRGIEMPEYANVQITFNGIKTADYSVSDIVVDRGDAGEDISISVLDPEITVSLTGHSSVLDLISPEDITLTASLNGSGYIGEDGNVIPGRYVLPAEVSINGNPQVAVVGEYEVTVEIGADI